MNKEELTELVRKLTASDRDASLILEAVEQCYEKKNSTEEMSRETKIENLEADGKFFIIKDLKFSDYFKDDEGKLVLFDTFDRAWSTCGMYEFPHVLVCMVLRNSIED